MQKYEIGIEETLRRVINVEAENIDEAIEIATNKYDSGEIVLDSSDFCDKTISNIYSKKLEQPINIFMKYNPKDGIITIVQDNNKEGKYVCDTVEDLSVCLKTYTSNYMETPEIPSNKELEEVTQDEELER